MAKHKPAVLWAMHKVGRYPNVYLSTVDNKTIKLKYYWQRGGDGISINLSRRMAGLLARRLNQILDQTK